MITQPESKNRRSIWRFIGIFVLSLIVLLIIFVGYIWLFEVPDNKSIQHPTIKQASELYDTNGKYIGIYQAEYRSPITYQALNPDIKACLLAVEDSRFFEHNGVDFRALARVILKSILMNDKESGGGSTITQQLAKQLFPRPDMKNHNFLVRSFLLVKSKIKEWIIAIKLENIFSKEDILMMYLNKFEFINGAHGIDAASKTYFGKPQTQLTLNEAATLVGMLKNPSLYNPVRFPQLVNKRKNEVLTKLEEQSKKNYNQEKKLDADFSAFRRYEVHDTIVPYFKASLVKYLEELIQTNNLKKPDGSFYDIYSDGLKIESTIDLAYQKYAEEATNEHMIWIQKWFGFDWVKKDPWTYQADDREKQIRAASLEQKAKNSVRYENLRKKYLNRVYATAKIPLTEDDLELLARAENDPSVLNGLTEKKKKQLNTIKENKNYKTWKSAYQTLQAAYKREFSTKIKMKIFDSKKGLVEVQMSPMDSVRYHAMLLQTGLVAIDPHNGFVKCWNGGLNFDYFKYDHVISRRSIGSTAKPFLYTVAMSQFGIKPCDQFQDISYSILPGEGKFKNKEPWHPQNATKINTTLMYNLYHGLLYSKNSITVKILKEVGSVEPLRDMWDQMGISKTEKLPNGRLAVPELPSIALGAVDITLLQLTAAYSTFANQGKYQKPILIKKITDKNGKVIFEAKPTSTKVIDPLYNAIMLDMLVNNETGEFSMHLKTPNGGKTGTTDDQCDGWYMGLTPNLVVGVWTGGDDKWIRFLRDDVGQGYFTAKPVFEKFIRKLENDKTNIFDSKAKFATPPDGFKELTNCSKHKTEPLPEFLRPLKPAEDSLSTVPTVQDSLKIN